MKTLYINVESKDALDKITMMRDKMKPQTFTNAMYGIYRRTGGHVKRILRGDLPQEYEIRPGEINRAVKNPKISAAGAGAMCTIPIDAPRRVIGPKGFAASGGAHGWNSFKRKYRVKARIVKSGRSELPAIMRSYGEKPPFRNLGAEKLNNLTYTRKGDKRLPIQKVVGIAIPQMPMNRSEKDVQQDIREFLEKQIEQRFNQLIMSGR